MKVRITTGRRWIGAVALLAGALLVLLGCGGGAGGGGSTDITTSKPSVSGTSPAPSPSVSSRSPGGPVVTSPSTTATPREPVWSSEPRRVEHPLYGNATVVAVRSAHNVAGGMAFDRLTIELQGQIPGYEVRYVAEVLSPGEGVAVPLRGQAFLEVVLFPAVAHDETGRSTLRTPQAGGGLPALVQYRMTGDYEGYVHFGLGVDDRVGFRVLELSNPSRVVIDLAA
ncbi:MULTISPECIES: AMIN-like domain-containing (lipo)protein [unclassified Frankia]